MDVKRSKIAGYITIDTLNFEVTQHHIIVQAIHCHSLYLFCSESCESYLPFLVQWTARIQVGKQKWQGTKHVTTHDLINMNLLYTPT